MISIHAPQWGATTPPERRSHSAIFQSTHPSGVRPPCSRVPAAPCNFNPRTPVGCDRGCRPRAALPYHFNPRTPVGCDVNPENKFHTHCISIHAPQWGATEVRAFHRREHEHFNPRTPVGCDRFPTEPARENSTFQSTHPSGCVLASWRPLWGVVTFCWTSLSVWSLVSVPDGFRRRARAGCVCP